MPGVHIVWFKRDLRAHDHAALAAAAAAERGTVLPLFIVEPELWRQPDYAGRHWAFAAECLIELRAQLSALGQPLVVRVGEAVPVLGGIAKELPIEAVWSHEETGNGWTFQRDLSVKRFLTARQIPWHELPQNYARTISMRSASRLGTKGKPAFQWSTPACAPWGRGVGSTFACGRCWCRSAPISCGCTGAILLWFWPACSLTTSLAFTTRRCRCNLERRASIRFASTTRSSNHRITTRRAYSSDAGCRSLQESLPNGYTAPG